MSATKVDVLGPLASMSMAHGEKWEAIHDAVAELIEAGRDFAVDDSLDAQKRFKAALARIGITS